MRYQLPFLLVGALLVGCSENSFHAVADRPDEGSLELTGWVCDTERNTWLEGANVYTHLLDSDGVLYATIEVQSDAEGKWVMEGLKGSSTYDIYVTYGSALLDMFEIEMPETDHTLEVPDCAGQSALDVAVITGDYDDFGDILTKVGVSSYELVNGQTGAELVQFLTNDDALVVYDAILLAGGHIEEDVFYDTNGDDTAGNVARVQQALRAYVEAGGMVYASDWSYDVIEQVWPGKLEFYGEDSKPNAAQVGAPATVTATVTDEDLEAAIGNSSVPLEYDLDSWPVVESVADSVTVHLVGDGPYQIGFDEYTMPSSPMLVSFKAGAGRVVFSSWRQTANSEGRGMATIRYMMDSLQQE